MSQRSDSLLVFVTNALYFNDTIAAIQSAVDVGGWAEDICCIIDPDVSVQQRALLEQSGVFVLSRDVPPFVNHSVGRYPASVYSKLWIFIDEFFRSYSCILFFDSDSIFLRPISNIPYDYAFSKEKPIGFRNNFNKEDDWYRMELYEPPADFQKRYPNHDLPIGSCCFVVSMQHLPTIDEMYQRFKGCTESYQHIFLYADQGLLATVFYDQYFLIREASIFDPSLEEIEQLDLDEEIVFLHTGGENRTSLAESTYHSLFNVFFDRFHARVGTTPG